MNVLRRIFGKDLRIKAGLFGLAAMLWLLVVSERTYEYDLHIPINAVGLRPDKVVISDVPTVADVRFQGSGRALMQLKLLNKPHLDIDLSTIKRFYRFDMSPDLVVIPGGITAQPLFVIAPDSIEVTLRDREEKMLPVKSRIRALPAAGYTLAGRVKLTPAKVKVVGPKDKLDNVESVSTIAAEFKDIKRDIELDVEIMPPYEFGTLVTPPRVRALIRVERLTERLIKGVGVQPRNGPAGREMLLDPVTVDVNVNGGVTALARMTPDSLSATVDFQELDVNTGKAPVRVQAPPGIEVGRITPEQLRIIIRKR